MTVMYEWGIPKRESHTFVESFLNWDDAVSWVEGHFRDHPQDEWVLEECRINYINYMFRAGITFVKIQGDLFE